MMRLQEPSVQHSYQQYLPISIAGEQMSVNSILENTMVKTIADGSGNYSYIPLKSLVKVIPSEDLKNITAGKNGEYIPLNFYNVKEDRKSTRLNSSHQIISYAVFCLKKKNRNPTPPLRNKPLAVNASILGTREPWL